MSGLVQKRIPLRGNGSNPTAAGRSISLRSLLKLLSVGEPVSPAFALTASLQTLKLPARETMDKTRSKRRAGKSAFGARGDAACLLELRRLNMGCEVHTGL